MHNSDFAIRIKFGRNIDRLRLENEMTQIDLARKSGLSQPAICNYINLMTEPKLSAAMRIAKALGVEIEELLK